MSLHPTNPGQWLPGSGRCDPVPAPHGGSDRAVGGTRRDRLILSGRDPLRAGATRYAVLRHPLGSGRRHRPPTRRRSLLHSVSARDVRCRHLDVHGRADARPRRRCRGVVGAGHGSRGIAQAGRRCRGAWRPPPAHDGCAPRMAEGRGLRIGTADRETFLRGRLRHPRAARAQSRSVQLA